MKNTKELGNLLANKLRVGGGVDTGASQIGTANVPEPVAIPPIEGGIVIPISQLGNVTENDIITLRVIAINDDNVTLEKVEEKPINIQPPVTPVTMA